MLHQYFIGKKNGKLRLVTDYKGLNQFTKDDVHVIPKIEDIFQSIGTSTILSKIDLPNGFNQLRLAKSSRLYTTFSVMGRKYQYKSLPFGIKIGPKVFQGVMNKILAGIERVVVYIDDIVIATNSVDEHYKILKKVLE